MAPNTQCAALNAAMSKKGASYASVATQIGSTEQHVSDICNGKVAATPDEFKKLAAALDITEPLPSDPAHGAK